MVPAEVLILGGTVGEQRVQRRLAAILAADVVGYSRLTGVDEEGTIARLRALRRELIDPTIAAHRGRIVKTTGDGILIEFASVVDAVRCAVELQQQIAEQELDLPADRRIAFRMGVNVGDVVVDGDDLLGDGINVAARLESIAEAGGVCISEDAYRQVRGKVSLEVVDLGEQHLKNIAEPMRAYSVRSALPGDEAHAAPLINPAPARLARPAIVVLPFHNLSDDAQQEYLADGLTEDIITDLARLRWLLTIARNSAFAYKGQTLSVRKIGQELRVSYILEGAVRRAGDRIRVTARLIDANADSQIWAERYDRNANDLFALQDEITRRIVLSLVPEVQLAELDRARRNRAESLDAWDLFLRASALYRENTSATIEEAKILLRRAIQASPNYAAAYARLSACYLRAAYGAWTKNGSAAAGEALALARKAASIATDEPLAYDALGSAQLYLNDPEAAVVSARRALDLDSTSTAAAGTLINALAFLGRSDEALAAYKETEWRNPRDPDMSGQIMGLANAYFAAGRFEEAVVACQRHMLLQPNWYGSRVCLAASYANLGRYEEARTAAADLLRLVPRFRLRHVERMVRNRQVSDYFARGLRLAGIPE